MRDWVKGYPEMSNIYINMMYTCIYATPENCRGLVCIKIFFQARTPYQVEFYSAQVHTTSVADFVQRERERVLIVLLLLNIS